MPVKPLSLLLSFAVMAGFYALVLLYSVNVPQQDDYNTIIAYLLNSRESFLNGLFDIHVSHRLVATRLLARLSLLFGPGVDLRIINAVGASSLLGVTFLLYRSIANPGHRNFLLLPICLSVFSLFHWSDMAWATAAVQNYVALSAGVLTFYLFSQKSTWKMYGAVSIGVIAPYINSNGLLLLPILLLWSLIGTSGKQRNTKLTMVIAAVSLFGFSVFFYFLPAGPEAENLSKLQVPDFETVLSITRAYFEATAGYLHFEPLAFAVGFLINIYFIALTAFGYFRKNEVVFYTFLYILLSIMLIALFRHELGLRQIIASRYQIFTMTLNALMLISFIESGFERFVPIQRLRGILLSVPALLYLASFYYLSNLTSEKNKIWNGLEEWHKAGVPSLYHPEPEKASEILTLAIDAGIYFLPRGIE